MPRVLILIGLLFIAFPAHALQSPWMSKEHMKVRLLSGYAGVGTLDELPAALEVELQPEWYTYWRMSGDSGLPPQMDWSESENVKDVTVGWPMPSRFVTAGLQSFGYDGTALFPLTVTPEEPGKKITLNLKIDSVVCKDICIPQSHNATLPIPSDKALRTEHNFRIEQAMKDLPATEDTKDLKLTTAVLGKESVVVTGYASQGFDSADVLIEVPGSFLTLPPEIIIGGDPKQAVFKVPAPEHMDDLTSELFGKKVTVTLINRGKAIEKEFQF